MLREGGWEGRGLFGAIQVSGTCVSCGARGTHTSGCVCPMPCSSPSPAPGRVQAKDIMPKAYIPTCFFLSAFPPLAFRVHLGRIKLAKEVEFYSERLAALTPGMSGMRGQGARCRVEIRYFRGKGCNACPASAGRAAGLVVVATLLREPSVSPPAPASSPLDLCTPYSHRPF